ncbi:MAG: rhomboid family intramembrane serine protease [Chitinivibrionales bacterium]|nr:rhomboid family intramembrane serine protease [Chitinivibrionales bacterium]MBD3356088.1 rhomboid family intramembrane serine protease [Chitinivibrionales bacterium]
MMSYDHSSLPKGIRNLLIANVAVFLFEILPWIGKWIFAQLSLVPALVFGSGHIWRLVTYMFLHDPRPGAIWHLAFNMLALWMFGVEMERMWGTRRFIVFYFLCGVGAAILSVLTWHTRIFGASGAVLGVLTAYAFFFPHRRILLFFIFPVPVWVAVTIIGFISLIFSVSGAGGIAHLTHLGGIIIALIYLKTYTPVTEAIGHWQGRREEKHMRRRAEEKVSRARYFEEVVDPILKKINEQGMKSLTRAERKELEKASRNSPEKMRKSKIVPFDIHRKRSR